MSVPRAAVSLLRATRPETDGLEFLVITEGRQVTSLESYEAGLWAFAGAASAGVLLGLVALGSHALAPAAKQAEDCED